MEFYIIYYAITQRGGGGVGGEWQSRDNHRLYEVLFYLKLCMVNLAWHVPLIENSAGMAQRP